MTGGRRRLPYGTWPSPVTPERLATGTRQLRLVRVTGGTVWWHESRMDEGGRGVVMAALPGGQVRACTPPSADVGSRVYEYGGGAYAILDGAVLYVDRRDGRVHRADPDGSCRPLTPPGPVRHGDLDADPARRRVVCVREELTDPAREPLAAVVAVDAERGGEPLVLAAGADFYAAPRVSPDGRWVCWLAWDHPELPWDATRLEVAPLDPAGRAGPARVVAGGEGESVCQPQWAPDGTLWFLSDRDGWWNPWRWRGGAPERAARVDAEVGWPGYAVGHWSWVVDASGRAACGLMRGGFQPLAVIEPDGTVREVPAPYTEVDWPQFLDGRTVAHLGGSPALPLSVVRTDLVTGESVVLRAAADDPLPEGTAPAVRPVEFPTAGGGTAHALYYPPTHPEVEGPPGERPPLVVQVHGGPVGRAASALALGTAAVLAPSFWTSRGFAVLAVNYRGSVGYGRDYRRALYGRWGIAEVEDCAAAVRWAAGQGLADPDRAVIRGGSAGGWTVLQALARTRAFRAGADYFGVSDLDTFDATTHKLESRYTARLVAPAGDPSRAERSPAAVLDRIGQPLIVFQGFDDRVVPPAQSELVVRRLRERGVPVDYHAFAGEGHGFLRAGTIRTCLTAELAFYEHVLGLRPAAG